MFLNGFLVQYTSMSDRTVQLDSLSTGFQLPIITCHNLDTKTFFFACFRAIKCFTCSRPNLDPLIFETNLDHLLDTAKKIQIFPCTYYYMLWRRSVFSKCSLII